MVICGFGPWHPGWGSLDRSCEVELRKCRRHGDPCPGSRATYHAVSRRERPHRRVEQQPARTKMTHALNRCSSRQARAGDTIPSRSRHHPIAQPSPRGSLPAVSTPDSGFRVMICPRPKTDRSCPESTESRQHRIASANQHALSTRTENECSTLLVWGGTELEKSSKNNVEVAVPVTGDLAAIS